MRPLLRVVPPAEWALATDSEAEHIAFFTDDLGQLALATSALGLGLTVTDGAGRVAASAGDLGRLAAELDRRRSPLAAALARYLSPVEHWQGGPHELALARPLVMGIVNLTDDSFSGDGVGTDVSAALAHAERLRAEGADIIDVGAETARASRPQLEAHAEAAIAAPAVAALAREGHLVSIDTYKREVAEAAIAAGAAIVNDISGLTLGTDAAEAAAEGGAGYVLNYSYTVPKHRPDPAPVYDDVATEQVAWMATRLAELEATGLTRGRIAIDPGIAFGKSHDEDLQALRRLSELRTVRALLLAAQELHRRSGSGPEGRDLGRTSRPRSHMRRAHASSGCTTWRGRGGRWRWPRRSCPPHPAHAPDEGSWPWAAGATAPEAIAQQGRAPRGAAW